MNGQDEREPMDEREAMDEFEQSLQRALQRVDAPETLAKSVAAAVEAEEELRRGGSGWFRPSRGGLVYVLRKPRRWAVGALAAALLLGTLGVREWRLRQERVALADEQFTAAVRVTDHALQQTREQLRQAGVNLGQ